MHTHTQVKINGSSNEKANFLSKNKFTISEAPTKSSRTLGHTSFATTSTQQATPAPTQRARLADTLSDGAIKFYAAR